MGMVEGTILTLILWGFSKPNSVVLILSSIKDIFFKLMFAHWIHYEPPWKGINPPTHKSFFFLEGKVKWTCLTLWWCLKMSSHSPDNHTDTTWGTGTEEPQLQAWLLRALAQRPASEFKAGGLPHNRCKAEAVLGLLKWTWSWFLSKPDLLGVWVEEQFAEFWVGKPAV